MDTRETRGVSTRASSWIEHTLAAHVSGVDTLWGARSSSKNLPSTPCLCWEGYSPITSLFPPKERFPCVARKLRPPLLGWQRQGHRAATTLGPGTSLGP